MTRTAEDWNTSVPGRRDFPSTCWSKILESGWKEGVRDSTRLEELARHYWKPIYSYIRRGWRKPHDEARDLTQDFFVWMMESDFLSKADPKRGRFRAFVQVALKYYLANDQKSRACQKRGGDRPILTLGEVAEWGLADDGPRTPEEILDRTWRGELLVRAARELERTLEAEGRGLPYRVFRDFHLGPGPERPSQREIAARYGIQESDVPNLLARTKERYRSILTDLVAQTVTNADELDEELKFLFGEDSR